MLGGELMRSQPTGIDAVPSSRADTDLADAGQVAELFQDRFDGVIHAAGYTRVDDAENDEQTAYRDNAETTREIAAACAKANIPLVVVSTDFVFDGDRDEPYGIDATPSPLGAYARTKLAAERTAMAIHPKGTRIVRTGWLYGRGGRHFPGRILELAKSHDELKVVDDQRGSPTSTVELVPALYVILEQGEPGVYHATCDGSATWYDLACATLDFAGVTSTRVVPCRTSEFPRPAERPRNSTLDCSRLTALRGRPLAPWRDALHAFSREDSA